MNSLDKKVDIAKAMLVFKPELSDEENDEHFDIAFAIIDELIATQNSATLGRIMEFFTEENEEYEGLCEHIESGIGANYSLDQIASALYNKFNDLLKNDVNRAVHITAWFLNKNRFEEIRAIFNKTKPAYAPTFIERLKKWVSPDYLQEIAILKKDMEVWQ